MKGKVSIFDVDGTLSKSFYIVKFPEMLYKKGLFSKKKLGEINEIFEDYLKGSNYPYEQFAWDVVIAFGYGIKGKKWDDIKKMGKKYIQLHPEEKFPFTDSLVRMVKNKGYRTVIISGSPYEIILPFSMSLGIDEAFATTYEIDNGIFTGEVAQNCAIDKIKKKVIQKYLQEYEIDLKISTGFGDSEHDLGFLEIVGYPVIIKPNKKLEEIAKKNRWLICKEDKKVLDSVKLYLP